MPNKPRILILFPNPIATIPGGFTYVGKRFKRNGFEVKAHINTFRNFRSMDRLFEEIIQPFKPDIVGLSFGTYNILEVYRLQQLCKKKGYFLITGGNHPSIKPEEGLRYGADMVFRGEAECSIDDFCKWFTSGKNLDKRNEIIGISYLDSDGKVVHNKKPPRVKDLDDIGAMDFSTLNLDEFRVADGSVKGLNVISCGRGCPFRCSFCSHSDWYQYGRRSVDSIIEEMVDRNKKYGVEIFWMSDETFTVDKNHVYEFCEKFVNSKLPFKWMMGTRVDTVDEDLLRTMRDSGLSQITYGIESADNETLKKINKGYTAEEAKEVAMTTGKLNIPMYVNLMAGFPWETPEHVENNIRFIREVDKYVYCYQLYGAVIPYPDTPIYTDYHEQEGFTDFWLKEKYQNAGMVIYQNVANPYKVSTFFQRHLYDDTYIAEDYFFKFTPEYKKAVARMGLLIGWKAIQAQYKSPAKQYWRLMMGVSSLGLYSINKNLEKRIVGSVMTKNRVHDARLTGKFIKK
jgi:anaerobic magnesium-protoporphyrin IX monomethyl ester cyclase